MGANLIAPGKVEEIGTVEEIKNEVATTNGDGKTKKEKSKIVDDGLVFKSKEEADAKHPRRVFESGREEDLVGEGTVRLYIFGTKVKEVEKGEDDDEGTLKLVREDGSIKFTWARNKSEALSYAAQDAGFVSELFEAGQRGRQAKIDPMYMQLFLFLLIQHKTAQDANAKKQFMDSLNNNLQMFPQYSAHVDQLRESTVEELQLKLAEVQAESGK